MKVLANYQIQNNTVFKGLLGAKELEDFTSSGNYHYARMVQDYYPFKDETSEGIDRFVKTYHKSNEYENAGETTYEEYVVRPLEKLGFTTNEYFKYRLNYRYGLPIDKKGLKIEAELKDKGLTKYLNELPKSKIRKVLTKVRKLLTSWLF